MAQRLRTIVLLLVNLVLCGYLLDECLDELARNSYPERSSVIPEQYQ